MSKRKMTKRSPEFWEKHLVKYHASGLGITAYADKIGVVSGTFQYWVDKERGVKKGQSGSGSKPTTRTAPKSNSFLQVGGDVITIEKNGIKISMPEGASVDVIKNIIQAMEA